MPLRIFMNYRHHYHAGSRADLIKHLVLAHLLLRLCQKKTPFCVMDTHAGAGLYDLHAQEAQKTGEAQSGIHAFAKLPPHPTLRPLQDVLLKLNPGFEFTPADNKGSGVSAKAGTPFVCNMDPVFRRDEPRATDPHLRTYPGSPALIRHYLREGDRLIAVEKHPEEAEKLRANVGVYKQVQVHGRDAWEAMGALVPTPEKRALVFMDPPFEQHGEMQQAVEAILKAQKRMGNAIYALWYPVKDDAGVARMKEQLRATEAGLLCAEAEYTKTSGMRGCGVMILNPPWQIDAVLKEALMQLYPLFDAGMREPVVA